jgi:ribose-phosphate pyrophosphokinase
MQKPLLQSLRGVYGIPAWNFRRKRLFSAAIRLRNERFGSKRNRRIGVTAATGGAILLGSSLFYNSSKCDDFVDLEQQNHNYYDENHGKEDEENAREQDCCIVSGSANPTLCQEIAAITELNILNVRTDFYMDGEVDVQILDGCAGKTVFVIQPVSPTNPDRTINDNMIELLLIVSCLKRSDARKVVAVVPYLGYARHDRIKKKRGTVAAADVAKLLEASGVDEVISVDLRQKQIEVFFDSTPVHSLESSQISIPFFVGRDLWQPVIVCPNTTSVTRAKKYMEKLRTEGVKAKLAFISKEITPSKEQIKRQKDNPTEQPIRTLEAHDVVGAQHEITQTCLVGNVAHSDVIIVDDMIDTGSRVLSTANLVKKHGAKRIFVWAPHGVLSGNTIEKLENSPISEILITNTLSQTKVYASGSTKKIKTLSIAPLLAEAIRRFRVRQSFDTLSYG